MCFVCLLWGLYIANAQEAIIIDTSGNVRVADTPPVPIQNNTPTVSVDFQNADIHAVMRFLATTGNTNIILDDQVQGKVTVRLENVRWEDAFTAVLWSQGLMAVPLSSMYLISPMQAPK